MEKVKIKTCIDTGKKAKNGNPIIEVMLEDGRKCSAFDQLFMGLPIGQEIEMEVKLGNVYQGVQQYILSIPGSKSTGKFPAKDWNFEKRKASLEASIMWCVHVGGLETKDIILCADAFFNYLNRKEL